MSDESVECSESLKQRKREVPDVGGRDESPDSTPIAQSEPGTQPHAIASTREFDRPSVKQGNTNMSVADKQAATSDEEA